MFEEMSPRLPSGLILLMPAKISPALISLSYPVGLAIRFFYF
jgi:hypothetical protein